MAAFLVFDDESYSSFDVLNNKTIALWNTIIGSGDAKKPSNKTSIRLAGQLDSLHIKIFNGKKFVIDHIVDHLIGVHEFIVNDTGCEALKIVAFRKENFLFEGEVPLGSVNKVAHNQAFSRICAKPCASMQLSLLHALLT